MKYSLKKRKKKIKNYIIQKNNWYYKKKLESSFFVFYTSMVFLKIREIHSTYIFFLSMSIYTDQSKRKKNKENYICFRYISQLKKYFNHNYLIYVCLEFWNIHCKVNWTECLQLCLISEFKRALYGLVKGGCFWNF